MTSIVRIFRNLAALTVALSVATASAAEPSATTTPLAYQQPNWVAPDPAFFPDDPAAGRELDKFMGSSHRDEEWQTTEPFLTIARKGLRRCATKQEEVVKKVGHMYVWNRKPAPVPEAVELMYHATTIQPDTAVYYGLARVEPTPNIVRALADVCMLGSYDSMMIVNGMLRDKKQLLAHIEKVLQDPDPDRREMADILIRFFRDGESPIQRIRDRLARKALANHAQDLPAIKQKLETGDSATRLQVLVQMFKGEQIRALDDSFLQVMRKCAADPDPKVRRGVAGVVGTRWLWGAPVASAEAVEIETILARDSDPRTRYDAVYHGLSVVEPKTPELIALLIEVTLSNTDNSELVSRVRWSLRDEDSTTVLRAMEGALALAGKDPDKRAALAMLHEERFNKPAPAEWGLLEEFSGLPQEIFAFLVVPARGKYQPATSDELWSEFRKELPAEVQVRRLMPPNLRPQPKKQVKNNGDQETGAAGILLGEHSRELFCARQKQMTRFEITEPTTVSRSMLLYTKE